MAGATRTQIYLTHEQRANLDALRSREGKSLAEVVRAAIDAYLPGRIVDAKQALGNTFGAIPKIKVPLRDEWDRV